MLIAAKESSFHGTKDFRQALIGINDIYADGTWKTVDGKPLEYVHWADGEPNNGIMYEEDCGALTINGFNDVKCHNSYAYICEILMIC